MSEEQKNRILVRRAKFIAAAMAVGAISEEACGGTIVPSEGGTNDASMADGSPQVCLKMAVDSGPQPCLTPIMDDAGKD